MSSESNPVADWVPANELIFHLRSSFFPHEFDFVAKTLTDREDQLVSDNVKLNDELKVKQSEICGVMKLNADYIKEFEVYEKQVLEIVKKSEEEKGLLVLKNAEFEKRIGAYEKRSSDDFGFKFKAEKEKKVMVLEKVKLVDELKARRSEIDEALKVNAEREWEIAVCKKRVSDYVEFQKMAEEEKRLLVLENLELNDELRARRDEIDAVNAECRRKIGVYEKMAANDLEFKLQVVKEKEVLASKNLKLNEELETKRNEIDMVMKVNAEYERKIGVYEKRYLDELAFKTKAEEEKQLLVLELKARLNETDAAMKANDEYKKRLSDELELRRKAEEEKDQLVFVNSKLNDEFKTKQNVIDEVMKVNAEFEEKSRVYEKRSADDLEFKLQAGKDKGVLVSKNLKLNEELEMKRNEIDLVRKVNAEYERKIGFFEKRVSEILEFKRKAEEEKELLVSKNWELFDELKTRRNEIDAAMKVKAECERKIRDCEKRYLDELALKSKAEEEKQLLVLELKARRNETDAAMKVNDEYKKRSLDELELRTKAEEERDQLVSENSKLNDELKTKQNMIDEVTKMNAEFEEKSRVYEKQAMDDLEFRLQAGKEKGVLVTKNLKLNEELETKVNEIDLVRKVNVEYERQIGDYEKRVLEFLKFKRKAEEEKELLVSKNLELDDELKTIRDEIDAAMKVKAECEGKIRDFEKRYLDELALKSKAEEEKGLLVLEMKERRKESAEYEREFMVYKKRSSDELELRTKAEEERDQLLSVNSKLNDELKTKQNVIAEVMKVNAEFEEKSRVNEKQSMDNLELTKKAEEEKQLLVLENLKLIDELKMKQNEIDAVMMVISEHGSKTRVCTKRSLESDANDFGSEKLVMGSVGSGKEKKDCTSESDRKPPLVSVQKDSKRKTEVKLPEIINIDDDDDDDLESVPTNKRRQVLNEKTELRYSSRLSNTCRNK